MKVYDIDAAIRDQRPVVRLRGEDYPVADYRVSERIRITADRMKLHGDLVEREGKGEDVSEDLQKVQGYAIQAVLEGVPDDIVEDCTEREFEAIMLAVAAAKRDAPSVKMTEEEPAKNAPDPEQS